MSPNTRKFLEAVGTWPEEDQEELLHAARDIEAKRKGGYEATPEELVGIDRGLEEAQTGRFATDEKLAARRAKFRGGEPHKKQGGLDLAAADAYRRSKGIKKAVPFIADDFDAPLPEDFLINPLPRTR